MITLQQRLKNVCNDFPDVEFRNDYSGRSMFGKKCVGITGTRTDCMKVISETLQEIAAGARFYGVLKVSEYFDTLLGFDMDNMGRDMILYWPQLESIAVPAPDDTDNG